MKMLWAKLTKTIKHSEIEINRKVFGDRRDLVLKKLVKFCEPYKSVEVCDKPLSSLKIEE